MISKIVTIHLGHLTHFRSNLEIRHLYSVKQYRYSFTSRFIYFIMKYLPIYTWKSASFPRYLTNQNKIVMLIRFARRVHIASFRFLVYHIVGKWQPNDGGSSARVKLVLYHPKRRQSTPEYCCELLKDFFSFSSAS